MKKKLTVGLPSLIVLHSFTTFPEYFISISVIYVLVVSVLITNNVYNFLIQHVFSNCLAVILFMSTYLIFNDNLLTVNTLSFNNSFINDYFSYFTKFSLCLFSSLYFYINGNFLKEQKLTSFEYLLLILFSTLGFLLMCSCNDLLTGYLAIELSAFSLYILASFKKTSSYSIDGGMKYYITGAISSAFYLIGSSFIYGFSGSINFSDFQNLFNCSSNFIPNFCFV
jgi:NADH-quinone oxidoreductase subunit N